VEIEDWVSLPVSAQIEGFHQVEEVPVSRNEDIAMVSLAKVATEQTRLVTSTKDQPLDSSMDGKIIYYGLVSIFSSITSGISSFIEAPKIESYVSIIPMNN